MGKNNIMKRLSDACQIKSSCGPTLTMHVGAKPIGKWVSGTFCGTSVLLYKACDGIRCTDQAMAPIFPCGVLWGVIMCNYLRLLRHSDAGTFVHNIWGRLC